MNSVLRSKTRLATLLLFSCISFSQVGARFSKVNMKSAIKDYEESFVQKDYGLEEEDFALQPQASIRQARSEPNELIYTPDALEVVQPKEHRPFVGQEDTYEGYLKPKEAFSSTDGYRYALQFYTGA